MASTVTDLNQPHDHAHGNGHGNKGLAGLVVGAIGVVFGDIGTSPLYTLKEAFSPHYGLVANHDTVLGILSLVFWALMIVVTLKYVTIIMRADNDGEGGIMALMALSQRILPKGSKSVYVVGILGHLRRVAVLRRQRDHPGDDRAVGDRGPGGRGAEAARLDRAAHHRRADRCCSPRSASARRRSAACSAR